MSRDIGDTDACDVSWSLGTPAIGRGLVVGCASSPWRARCGGSTGPRRCRGRRRVTSLLVDDGQDAPAGVGGADPQVMQPAGPAQGHAAIAVDGVVAQAEVARRAAPGGMRLGPRG